MAFRLWTPLVSGTQPSPKKADSEGTHSSCEHSLNLGKGQEAQTPGLSVTTSLHPCPFFTSPATSPSLDFSFFLFLLFSPDSVRTQQEN